MLFCSCNYAHNQFYGFLSQSITLWVCRVLLLFLIPFGFYLLPIGSPGNLLSLPFLSRTLPLWHFHPVRNHTNGAVWIMQNAISGHFCPRSPVASSFADSRLSTGLSFIFCLSWEDVLGSHIPTAAAVSGVDDT